MQSSSDWKRWGREESALVMIHANRSYFTEHKDHRELLLSTGNLPIVERNFHPDNWGITFQTDTPNWTDAQGKKINCNRQGWILMYLRDCFRK